MIAKPSSLESVPDSGSEIPLFAPPDKAASEFDPFFELPGNLLCIVSPDGYFERINSAWTALLGWNLEELSARQYIDVVHADDRAATLANLNTIGSAKAWVLFENRCRHRDGSYRCLQWNARSVPPNRRIYATARDVTEQQRQEKEILNIADRENERLGRDLHDGLCQSLAGIAALSSALSIRLSQGTATDLSTDAKEISQLLGEAIGDVRDMARGLDPTGLTTVGLDAALETLTMNVERLFRVHCMLAAEQSFPRLGAQVEGHLFRIAQEAMRNAVSHGRAERIEIDLASTDDSGRLRIRDDGVGLPDTACRSEGLGLHTMAYRARVIGASLDLRRRRTRGTTVTCIFPLSGNGNAQCATDGQQQNQGMDTRQ